MEVIMKNCLLRRVRLSGLTVSFLLPLALMSAFLPDAAFAGKPPLPPHAEGGYEGPGQDRGGYSGPGPELISAQEAAQREDGAWVALKGVITRSLGDRDYMFEDSSGSVEVAIGPREWKGQRVSAADTVEIHGRVHKDPARVHVHVKRLIKRQDGAI